MVDVADIQRRLLYACSYAESQGKRIVSGVLPDDQSTDSTAVTVFEAVMMSEPVELLGAEDGFAAVLRVLGLDEAAVFWLHVGVSGDDVAVPPMDVDLYNVGRAVRMRFIEKGNA